MATVISWRDYPQISCSQLKFQEPENNYIGSIGELSLPPSEPMPDRIVVRAVTGRQHFELCLCGERSWRYELTEADRGTWPGIGSLIITE